MADTALMSRTVVGRCQRMELQLLVASNKQETMLETALGDALFGEARHKSNICVDNSQGRGSPRKSSMAEVAVVSSSKLN